MPDPVEEAAAAVVAEEAAAAATAKAAEEAEETHDGFIKLDKHQKDVNVQHKRFRDEERGRVKERDRADGLQKEIDELKGQGAEIVIPPVPDKYSETFDADIKARDEAITAKAEQSAATERQTAERKTRDDARLAEADKAIEDNVAKFDSNMVGHGLNPVEVKTAVDSVIANGISTSFQDVLLEDKDGPLMVMYLKANPIETEKINRMSTLALVNHLNDEVRPKALLLKPQTSNAPDPPIVLDGGGAPETKENWEKGAVYE